MSKPFSISPGCRGLRTTYPPPELVVPALTSASDVDVARFIRAWLAEGIPFGFKEDPLVFEAARDSLAQRLEVSPRDITLVGSARIGYSLAGPEFGRGFQLASDLDFAAVSAPLFEHLRENAVGWMDAFRAGQEVPASDGERRYWPENERLLPQNIRRGFIDSKLIPNRERYPWAQRVNSSVARVTLSIAASLSAMRRRASLRVYRSWPDFTAQCSLSLRRAVKRAASAYPRV